jgi:two-component system chemotaxis sensor kinase CheA
MNDDLLDLFVEECSELVTRAQDDLVALEAAPADTQLLDDLFRAVHTLKGSVAFFDWPFFLAMLHAAEDLLSAIRTGDKSFDASTVDALGACINQTEAWLAALATTRELPANGEARAAPVTRALEQALHASAPKTEAIPLDAAADALVALALQRGEALAQGLFHVRYVPPGEAFLAGDDPVAIAQNTPGLIELRISEREPWTSLDDYDPYACNLKLDILSSASREEIAAAFDAASGDIRISPVTAPEPSESDLDATLASGERRTLRVDADRIDALVHTIDELIVAKNALSQLALDAQLYSGDELGQKIRDHQSAIGRLTARMHAAVTAMRLVPIGPALRRLPRVTRDLAARLGKQLDFILDCEEIEADKTIVDGLSEPLLHLVRNAVDHGVETADQRRSAGKPERSRIVVRARRDGDQVVIKVDDDGRGIDPARIRDVARERALLPPSAIDALDDTHVLDLVFRPGFSTASEISDVSGRGVGMDAVRSAVARLGGAVTIASTPGVGTSVSLSLPLSMVLTQIAVVECDGEMYGVPMDDIVELARVPAGEITNVRHGQAFFWRDRPVPVVSLESLLGHAERDVDANMRILVIRDGEDTIGVSIARLVERMEAVVSPIGGLLSGIRGFSGTTLMGNGSVLIVLDLPELIG